MKFHPFQSLPEALIYGLLLVMLLFTITSDLTLIRIVDNHSKTIGLINQDTQTIEKQQICIATFFDEPGNIRSQSSISTLKSCQPVLQETVK